MKKRRISVMAVVALMLTATTAFASSGGVVMFGDNVQRTHENGFTDKYPWSKEVYLGSSATGGISMASSSTAIGAGNIMFYPVSAGTPSNNFQGTGYMTIWDMSKWAWNSNTSQDEPTLTNAIQIPNVSNSSPVYYNGYAYLAAGTELYKFDANGQVGNPVSIGGTGVLNGGNNYNQVVSYPLLVGSGSSATLWVSTQNGYVYAIDPTTMTVIHYINIGVRLDSSPALISSANGTSFIAVTGAFDQHNASYGGSSGTGMLFIINPTTSPWTVNKLPSPAPTVYPSVASPVSINSTISGGIMWNDINGDVFLGTVNPDGTVTYDAQKDNTGNGQTSDFSESGFSSTYDQYIVPFTDGGTYGYAAVNPKTYDVKQVAVAGNSGPIKAFGSPEISASGNLYLADTAGGIDQIVASSSGGFGVPSSKSTYLPSQGTSAGTTLSTPSELMLDTKIGTQAPTLTLATNQGLEMWVNGGANYTFGGDYTSTQPTQFTTPLVLILGANDLPTSSGNNDQIAYSMSVNGGSFNYVTESPVYSGATPQSPITLSTSLLNSTFAPWKQSGWQSGQTNTVKIRAYAPSSDQYGYMFNSADSGQNQPNAEVTVTFPAGTAIPPVPIVSDSDTLPYYVIMRFIMPGGPDKQGVLAGYPQNLVPQHHVYQDTPIAESTDGSHSGVFSLGITDGYHGTQSFTLKAEVDTVVDQSYQYTYISGWTPIFGAYGGIIGYNPVYNTITLHHNLPVTETTEQSFTMTDGWSELWNPWNVTATIQGGSPSTMNLHGFAPFGAWIPPADAYPNASNADYSQGGDLNGHINDKGGTYPLNATYGEPSTTNFAPYDAQHNNGVLVEPAPGAGDVPQAAGWNPQIKISVVSGQPYFSYPGAEDFMQTWNFGIIGPGIGKADGTSTTMTWKWVPITK